MGNWFDPVLNQVLTRGMVLTDQWSLVVFDPGDGSVVASAPEGDGRRVVDIKWLCSPEGEGRVVGKKWLCSPEGERRRAVCKQRLRD